MLLVRMTMLLRNDTTRPWLSVTRPSSSICSSTLKTSACAFSLSSAGGRKVSARARASCCGTRTEEDYGVGAAAHRLRQLPALLEAHVAGRRADEPRHRVLLHVL